MPVIFDLNHTPEEAVAFMRNKGLALSESWQDVWQEANQRAFTVAKATSYDILSDIKNSVDASVAQGKTFEQFKKELEPELRKKGWWGKESEDPSIFQYHNFVISHYQPSGHNTAGCHPKQLPGRYFPHNRGACKLL